MGRAAKKPNFLFTEDEEPPAEMLAAVGLKASDTAPRPGTGSPPTPPPPNPTHGDDELPVPTPDDEDDPPVPEEDEPTPDEEDEETADDLEEEDRQRRKRESEEDEPEDMVATHPSGVHYEARITIVDAWQYPGSLKNRPDWVDPNWAAYGSYDELRDIEPGPALRVPLPSGLDALVRIGDYVARQEVRLEPDKPGELRLEVWEEHQFQRLFIPRPSSSLMKLPPGSADLESATDRLHRIYAGYEQKILADIDMLATSGFSDKRWCAIARTKIEEGFMALHRALRDYPEDNPRDYGKRPHHEPLPASFDPPVDPEPERNVASQSKIEWKEYGPDERMDPPDTPGKS